MSERPPGAVAAVLFDMDGLPIDTERIWEAARERVAREAGGAWPDVWIEAARRLEADPDRCVAVEDSTAGIRSAHAAGLAVVAVPDAKFPPAGGALALAAAALDSLAQLTPEVIERVPQ